MAEEEVPSLAGMSAEELRELMRDLLPKLDLPILDMATLEEGAAYTCKGGQVLASTATVTPEALQPLAMAEGKAICVSTGGFTDDARAYGSEFGVELYEAQDLARMVSEHRVRERELRPAETGLRFLPSIGTLEAIMNEASKAFAAGNYVEAASHYRQAVALKPHYDFAWALLGVCHQRLEADDEAVGSGGSRGACGVSSRTASGLTSPRPSHAWASGKRWNVSGSTGPTRVSRCS